MEQIKVGIIGAGFIGKQHIEAVRRIPGLTVLALCDTNEKAGREIAQNLGIPEFYSDILSSLRLTYPFRTSSALCEIPFR